MIYFPFVSWCIQDCALVASVFTIILFAITCHVVNSQRSLCSRQVKLLPVTTCLATQRYW